MPALSIATIQVLPVGILLRVATADGGQDIDSVGQRTGKRSISEAFADRFGLKGFASQMSKQPVVQ